MIEGAVYVRRSNLLGKLYTFPNATSTEVYRAVTVLRHLAPGGCPGSSYPGAPSMVLGGQLGLGFTNHIWGGVNVSKGGVNVLGPFFNGEYRWREKVLLHAQLDRTLLLASVLYRY